MSMTVAWLCDYSNSGDDDTGMRNYEYAPDRIVVNASQTSSQGISRGISQLDTCNAVIKGALKEEHAMQAILGGMGASMSTPGSPRQY